MWKIQQMDRAQTDSRALAQPCQILLTAAGSTWNLFRTDHLENNPPSRKLLIPNSINRAQTNVGRIVRGKFPAKATIIWIMEGFVLEEIIHFQCPPWTLIREKNWYQWTQISGILNQTAQNWTQGFGIALTSWKCRMQTSRQVWDQPREWGHHSQIHQTVLGTTNTNGNLDVQGTLCIFLFSLGNTRHFPVSKESHILLKITVFFRRNYR